MLGADSDTAFWEWFTSDRNTVRCSVGRHLGRHDSSGVARVGAARPRQIGFFLLRILRRWATLPLPLSMGKGGWHHLLNVGAERRNILRVYPG